MGLEPTLAIKWFNHYATIHMLYSHYHRHTSQVFHWAGTPPVTAVGQFSQTCTPHTPRCCPMAGAHHCWDWTSDMHDPVESDSNECCYSQVHCITSYANDIMWHHFLSRDCHLLWVTALYEFKHTQNLTYTPSTATSRWIPAKWHFRHFRSREVAWRHFLSRDCHLLRVTAL